MASTTFSRGFFLSVIQSLYVPESFQNNAHPCELFIYRGDLEHPQAPGNKWHKLKYHLLEAKRVNAQYIATFGGPFSNHLHAFSAILAETEFKGIAIVRGELHPTLTPTLIDVANAGIELWPCSRKDYRLAENSNMVAQINRLYPNVYWIPEGGGGQLGARGCQDWAADIDYLGDEYDAWVVSAGTGTTASGLLAYDNLPYLHVVSALKGAESQSDEILALAESLPQTHATIDELKHKMTFHCDAHEGGYAKQSKALLAFLGAFAELNPKQLLDPVYTSKALFLVMQKIHRGEWPHRRTLFIHTGGLQGWRGYLPHVNPFIDSSVDGDK